MEPDGQSWVMSGSILPITALTGVSTTTMSEISCIGRIVVVMGGFDTPVTTALQRIDELCTQFKWWI